MPVRLASFLTLLLVFAPARDAVAAEEFFFRDGDRVVMIGDSITEQHLYSNYVEMWVTTRFPAWDITFRNVGIGGDRSVGGNGRFKRDVLVHRPTAMTVDFGMNDGGYKPFEDATYKVYMGGLQGMADQAADPKIRVAWVTPQPLDNADQGPTALTGYNQTLEKYSAGVGEIAQKNGGVFVDQFHPYLATLDKARAAGAKYDRITAGDAVHPGPPGQTMMAAAILKGLHFPSLVSSAEIDAAALSGAKATNCRITKLAASGDGLRFEREDLALPFFPEDAKAILSWSPILDELNDYRLKVVGLKPGQYEVRLEGKKAATHSAEELAKGVNLAAAVLASGPIADQVKAIRTAIEAKNKFHHDRIFRGIVLSNVSVPDWLDLGITPADIETRRKTAIDERMAKLPELDTAIRQAAKIKPHQVEIARVGA